MQAISGSGPGDVFAVGAGGAIWHSNGTTWTSMASPTTAQLNGVAGTSASDVYAVGTSGTVLHYDGTAWTAVTTGLTLPDLLAVWDIAPDNVYAVGSAGTSRISTATRGPRRADESNRLYAVWGAARTTSTRSVPRARSCTRTTASPGPRRSRARSRTPRHLGHVGDGTCSSPAITA